MVHHTLSFVLSIIVAVIHFTQGQTPTAMTDLDRNCMSFQDVCNNMQLARDCGSYDWCKKQAISCEAEQFIKLGSTSLWRDTLKELEFNCHNNFEPFKKLYGSPDLVDIKLQVNPAREPFTISFNFKGDPTSENLKRGVSVQINDKLVYDDFNKMQSFDSHIFNIS